MLFDQRFYRHRIQHLRPRLPEQGGGGVEFRAGELAAEDDHRADGFLMALGQRQQRVQVGLQPTQRFQGLYQFPGRVRRRAPPAAMADEVEHDVSQGADFSLEVVS